MTRAPAACLLSVLLTLGICSTDASAAAARKTTRMRPPNPAVQIAAMSCSQTGDCSAVGAYEDALGESQGLLVTEKDGRWRKSIEARPPVGASTVPFKGSDGGGLVDVACPAAGDCVADGRYTDTRGIDHGLILTERDGIWRRGVKIRLPKDAIKPVKPKSGATEDVAIDAVACSSVGNCVAVGEYETTAEVWEGLIVTEHDGRWQRGIRAPLPADAPVAAQDVSLLDVTCPSNSSCTISGDYVDAYGHQEALLESGSAGAWTAAPAPNAPSDASSDPNISPMLVSCTDADDCAAVGTYINPLNNSLGLLLTESGGTWSGAQGAVLPAGAAPAGTVGDQSAELVADDCPATGDCIAVGWYFDNDENGQALLVSEQDGVWQPGIEVTLPANAVQGLEKQSAGLDWVSCASLGNCLATGVYTDAGYNSQGLLVSETDGIWQTAQEAPLPKDAAGVQYAQADSADCTAVGDCIAIGTYYDNRGRVRGFAISESGGVWLRSTALSVPAPTQGQLDRSLASILAPYGRAAARAKLRAAHGFGYTYDSVAAGTARVRWYARVSGKPTALGTGSVTVSGAGAAPLKLKLNSAGAALLRSTGKLRVTVRASFAPRSRKLRSHSTVGVFKIG